MTQKCAGAGKKSTANLTGEVSGETRLLYTRTFFYHCGTYFCTRLVVIVAIFFWHMMAVGEFHMDIKI